MTPAITVELSSKQIVEWQQAISKAQVHSVTTDCEEVNDKLNWRVPEKGWLKLNVDASIVMGESHFTIGMLIRDDLGKFVEGRNLRFSGSKKLKITIWI